MQEQLTDHRRSIEYEDEYNFAEDDSDYEHEHEHAQEPARYAAIQVTLPKTHVMLRVTTAKLPPLSQLG